MRSRSGIRYVADLESDIRPISADRHRAALNPTYSRSEMTSGRYRQMLSIFNFLTDIDTMTESHRQILPNCRAPADIVPMYVGWVRTYIYTKSQKLNANVRKKSIIRFRWLTFKSG
ncbi:Uncharacterised protein r2_g2483 [Pycnogonum litorale]